MTPMDTYKAAWQEIQPHLFSWVIFYLVFMTVSLGTCGLGGILMPNVMRELRDTRREGRGPSIGRLFEMRHIANDLINYLVWYGAIMVGSAAGGIGGTVAAVALQFQMALAADDRYAPLDNARISMKHVGAHLGDHVVFMVISTAMVMAALMLCMLPLPLIGPIMGMATWLWYEQSQQELQQMATEAGLKQLSVS
jgi:hypothetical protein